MSEWQLVGPKVPHRVWRSHLLVARGFDGSIKWSRLRPSDLRALELAQEQNQPTLLVLHGTGLRTRMGTAGFSSKDFSALKARYGQRILAFEHRAVRHGLGRNGVALTKALEALGADLRLHVLGISRGGLLARLLAEGWIECSQGLRIEKLIFVATPNDGSMSARRDKAAAKEMRAWRQDLRRLRMQSRSEADYSVYSDPYALKGHEPAQKVLHSWPMLNGTGDQLPRSPWLDRLNGFSGPPLFRSNSGSCRYYAIASVFDFEHGAPNPRLQSTRSWEEISRVVFSTTPNDLVVPTAGVFQPEQGPDACGRFPIAPERLVVLKPACNATHIGLLSLPQVRSQIIAWLDEPSNFS